MPAAKKKLLVVTSTFPRYAGDIVPARFVLHLSEQFCDRYDVHVLAPHAPKACFEEKLGKIKVSRFPYFFPTSKQVLCDGRGILPNMRASLLGKMQIPALLHAEHLALHRLIQSIKPNIIHSHWAVPQGLCVSLATGKNIPQILTIHSSDLHTLRRLPAGEKILRYIANRCHTIFLVSSYLRNLFLQMVPNPPCTLQVLPMGVDQTFYRPKIITDSPKWQLLYIGKMIEVKGIRYLLEAMDKIRRLLPKLRLTLLGDGEDRPKLEALARDFDPEGKIISFAGQIAQSRLPDYLAAADGLIVPSIVTKRQETEGMPTVILEALASGTPVLASRIGGLADAIIEGVNGLFFQHSNPEDLAAKINTFYQQKLWSTMPAEAGSSARKYAWPEIGRQYLEVFNNAC
ncbi:MAG: glycosyltransferase family 4 protein [Thermodesulfobacteriota bacterium]